MPNIVRCGMSDEEKVKDWITMYALSPKNHALPNSQSELNFNLGSHGAKINEVGLKNRNVDSTTKINSSIPSQGPEESVESRSRESEQSLHTGVQKMDEMEGRHDLNTAVGQSQESYRLKGLIANANAELSKSSKARSTSQKRCVPQLVTPGPEAAEEYLVFEDRVRRIRRVRRQACSKAATSPLDRHPPSPSQIPVRVKDKKLESGSVPTVSVKGKDIEDPTIVTVDKGNHATLETWLVEQTHSSNAKGFKVGSDTLPDQSKSTTAGSESEVHRNKTTVSRLTGDRNGDGSGNASPALKSSLVWIYNSGNIGTIEARDNIEVSLSNSENGNVKSLNLSCQTTVDLHNAGHIGSIHLS